MSRYCKPFAATACIILFVAGSCHKPSGSDSGHSARATVKEKELYTSLILSEDTLNKAESKALVKEVLLSFSSRGVNAFDPYYHYFKGRELELSGNKDSAMYHYRQIAGDTSDADLFTLGQHAVFNASIQDGKVIGADEVAGILKAIQFGEKQHSLFLYRLYDHLAKSYYTQRNIRRCMESTQLYMEHHPLRYSAVVRQRYHDIMCMLTFSRKDEKSMQKHLDSARALALEVRDTIALARTYDYQAQLFAYRQQFSKAVESSRQCYRILTDMDQLQMYVFNNLATSFEINGQLDSAIYYYKKAAEWSKLKPGTDLFPVYDGLADVYRKIKDYKNTSVALDSALDIYARNVERSQAEKIEEFRTRYQSEKKDQAIASLEATTRLNRKIIMQQRWFFTGGLAFLVILGMYMYNRYRRKLLMEKNEKLSAENKRLRLEQKTLQLQLNPHFIYNSMANLQGLVSSGDRKEAAAYLTAFSNLMRSILELNRQDVIPLCEEVEALEQYIRLQQMRYKGAFEYLIDTGGVDTEAFLVPPMLLQPFVENAIEHGFKNIDYRGMLKISIDQRGDQLYISILDNGSGTAKTGQPLKRSLSQSIIRERLDVLFNQEKSIAYFKAGPDKQENGKGYAVDLYIPLLPN
jgi:hypothetical protein